MGKYVDSKKEDVLLYYERDLIVGAKRFHFNNYPRMRNTIALFSGWFPWNHWDKIALNVKTRFLQKNRLSSNSIE